MDFSNVDIPNYEILWDDHCLNMAEINANNTSYFCEKHESARCPCVCRKMDNAFRSTFYTHQRIRPCFQLSKNPLTKKRKSPNNETCAICLNSINNHQRFLENIICSHFFHKTCIDRWLQENDTCPVCRKFFEPK
jgi:hypothetical protein